MLRYQRPENGMRMASIGRCQRSQQNGEFQEPKDGRKPEDQESVAESQGIESVADKIARGSRESGRKPEYRGNGWKPKEWQIARESREWLKARRDRKERPAKWQSPRMAESQGTERSRSERPAGWQRQRSEMTRPSGLFNNNCFNLFRKLSLEINISTGEIQNFDSLFTNETR